MRIVAVDCRSVRWSIAPGRAARDRNERVAAIIAVRGARGEVGFGEASPLPGMSIDTIEDAVRSAAVLAARAPIVIECAGHATAVADRITAAPAARFGIETALLAALAQHMCTSVAALWSAIPQGELRYAHVVDVEDQARHAVARGARCLKIKVGELEASASGYDRVARIARAAPGIRLRIDANRSWRRERVGEILASFAALPIEYVEEPCVNAHELLANGLPCRIALDESLVELSRTELSRALESPHLAALVLKPTLLGGFARCFELASEAHRHGVAPVVSHALEGPIGYGACIELARAISADVPVGLAPHSALDRFWEAV
jgi:o-succinylbenzoate synthase